MYRKYRKPNGNVEHGVIRQKDSACIPFDPANTDYADFKAQILADEAELQDADGNVMAFEQAKEFIASLP